MLLHNRTKSKLICFNKIVAFCPYHLGGYALSSFKMSAYVEKTNFDGLITTITGYIVLAIFLVGLHTLMAIWSFGRVRKIVGLSYIVIKVALLVIFEICVFPLICGVWLDVCALKLFNSTLDDRLTSFEQSPGTSLFVHWLVGMIYVFYFATFVFLLREVLRPGILWFLRNLNDPDFNPVQEMIQLPVFRHIRRFLTSVALFGFTIVLLLWLPIKLVRRFLDSYHILPYNMSQSGETLSAELSIELLWLHVALPALLEQSHIRIWFRNFVKMWAHGVAWLLGLRSFLLGDEQQNQQAAPENPNANANANNHNQNNVVQPHVIQNPFQFNIGLAHHQLLQNNTPFVNVAYTKPNFFQARVSLSLGILSSVGSSRYPNSEIE